LREFTECAIKRDQNQAFATRKSGQVSIRPLLRGWARNGSESAKSGLDSIRIEFRMENYTRISGKQVVGSPGLLLGSDLIAHNLRMRQQTEKAQLGYAAETGSIAVQTIKPASSNPVMLVGTVR